MMKARIYSIKNVVHFHRNFTDKQLMSANLYVGFNVAMFATVSWLFWIA